MTLDAASTTRSDKILADLQAYIRQELGTAARVASLAPMVDGHAGLTYGFEIQQAGQATERFILKLAPAGVPRSGSTDIFRQAKLLRALHRLGYPAPAIPWACADEAALGAPFIVMRRLAGRTFIVWEPDESMLAHPDGVAAMWIATAKAMGALHQVDWETHLKGWEQPVSLSDELDRWSKLLRHTKDPECLALASDLSAALRARLPKDVAVGLVHGDFQPGNVLFDQGEMTGVIDWDLAGIAPQGIDVGWVLMMADRDGWAEGWKPLAPVSRAELLDAYWRAGGPQRDHLDWFQAFAQFRMAAITGLNLKLHLDGRRHDPIWEKFAPSAPVLLRRAQALL